jgi:hypothetical protein
MTQYSKNQKPSPQTRTAALNIARATQQPGQSKEQTRLIAQGIQKGIAQYKQQLKSRARKLDKESRKLAGKKIPAGGAGKGGGEKIVYKQHGLPWMLLFISWLAGAVVFVLQQPL